MPELREGAERRGERRRAEEEVSAHHTQWNRIFFEFTFIQGVPALHAFWDFEKAVLHEIHVSGTVLRSPTNTKSPTCTYISKKPW